MGLAIDREHYTEKDYTAFTERLYQCLEALRHQTQLPEFGRAKEKIGAELELYIVDEQGQAQALNQELIKRSRDTALTVELNRYNLEINCEPVGLEAKAFSTLEQQLQNHIKQLCSTAKELSANVVAIGILPTLSKKFLAPEFMTDCPRYRVLCEKLLAMRGDEFSIHINGKDEIKLDRGHVTLEGANTSFQFHLMTGRENFADLFNACQLVTPLVSAVASNSPILLNKVLWDETRIALFKQSIDSRARDKTEWRQPARVCFGHGWVRESAWELFAEAVALYPPIFPIVTNENPLSVQDKGDAPALDELMLHMGTTWPWNRPIYAPNDGGHMRIEMRALPAGPSVVDMCANAAFATGLIHGLKDTIRDMLTVIPFRIAEHNFYRAAQDGLDAQIVWPLISQHRLGEVPITEVIRNFLPIAKQGLESIQMAPQDIDKYIGIIEERLDTMMTGARWQRQTLSHLEKKTARVAACREMFSLYLENQIQNIPVSQWDIPG